MEEVAHLRQRLQHLEAATGPECTTQVTCVVTRVVTSPCHFSLALAGGNL